MTGFNNRLIRDATPKRSSKDNKTSKPLKGKALADYVEVHKDEFQNDGDALCVSAGYGEYAEDGTPKCNFQPFVKELGKVMNLEGDEEKF